MRLHFFGVLAVVLALTACGGGGVSTSGARIGVPEVMWMSSGVWVSHVADPSVPGDADEGTFEIEFAVTSAGGDAWFNGTKPDLSGDGHATGLEFVFNGKGDAVLRDATFVSPTGALMVGVPGVDARFLVREGEIERFKVTAIVRALADGFVIVRISDIVYGGPSAGADMSYLGDLDAFFTPDLFLSTN